jgi:putative transposase
MARPLRIDVAWGWYHVTSRGINRQAIFREERDWVHFLDLVGEMPGRYGVLVHAYVLMTNHFHLLIQTPRANASRAMHWLKTAYTVWLNVKYGRNGPLFQGRFKAVLVDGNGSWALDASKYIHLNPVRLQKFGQGKQELKAQRKGIGKEATEEEIRKRLEVLRGYRWSSYRAYGGYEKGYEWLTTKELLRRAADRKQDAAKEYRGYIEAAVRQGETPPETWVQSVIWGSRKFMEKMAKYVKGDRREQRELRNWEKAVSFEDTVKVVERMKREKWVEFVNRHGDWGRDAVLWAARKWSGLTLREIGKKAGGMDYGAVSQAVRHIEGIAANDRKMRSRLQWVRTHLLNIDSAEKPPIPASRTGHTLHRQS